MSSTLAESIDASYCTKIDSTVMESFEGSDKIHEKLISNYD